MPRPPASMRSALVDRARLTTRRVAATGQKVSGRTPLSASDEPAPWFACRLAIPGEQNEDRGDRLSRVRVSRGPQLLFETSAEDGSPVQLQADDMLEVESNQVAAERPEVRATTSWQVNGQALVIRRKRRLFGAGVVGVTRVEEPERRGAARIGIHGAAKATSGGSSEFDT